MCFRLTLKSSANISGRLGALFVRGTKPDGVLMTTIG